VNRVSERTGPALFEFFNEIGIISQLSAALFAKSLPDGIHVSHFSILNHLARLGDGRTPVQIASAFQVTKATMTHSLSVLEGRGFIRMEPNPADGRSKLVWLTQAGSAFRDTAIESLRPAFAPLSRQLEAERLLAIIPDLRRVREILDRMR
jgi:DNA-binding MarR family transcriptional regulator